MDVGGAILGVALRCGEDKLLNVTLHTLMHARKNPHRDGDGPEHVGDDGAADALQDLGAGQIHDVVHPVLWACECGRGCLVRELVQA